MDTLQVIDSTVPVDVAETCEHGGNADHVQEDYLDRRAAVRAPVECPIHFISEERLGDCSPREGKLLDLSKTGCRIFTQHPPEQGSHITLVLPLPDGLPPIRLIGTMVCHVRGNEFGAKFQPLTPEERRRVQAVIFKYVTWSPYALRRPAFLIL